MQVEDFQGIHEDEPVAILFNGSTLKNHRLERIDCMTIGMNRTQGDYYVACDEKPWCVGNRNPHLFNCSGNQVNGIKVKRRQYKGATWSWDLVEEGIVCASAGYAALQISVYMGFNPIYCLGLDLSGPHFDGSPSASNKMMLHCQYEFFQLAGAILEGKREVYNVGSPNSKCDAFPHIGFREIWG